MNTLDRYILRALATNYLIALGVMMSLYVVLDLFFNIDEFTESDGSTAQVLGDVISYYGPNLFRYFGQLSGSITLFACLITISRFRRTNELTAMLASGISLFRVAAPVIGFGLMTSLLWVVDIELAVPSVAPQLARKHDDVRLDTIEGVYFIEDGENDLLLAGEFMVDQGVLKHLLVMERDDQGTVQSVIKADSARWEAIEGHPFGGKWVLTEGSRNSRAPSGKDAFGPNDVSVSEPVRYYESELNPRLIQQRQSAGWINFLSSRQLGELALRSLPPTVAVAVRQARHKRYTTPMVNMLLLLLGLPFVLNRERGNILSDAGKCMAVCGTCFVFTFMCQSAWSSNSVSALPAWLPVIVFAPLAGMLIDRIRT